MVVRNTLTGWRILAAPILGAGLAAAAPGCGKHLRGIDCPGQTVLNKGRAVLQETDAVEAVVAPVDVPWATQSEPIGFTITLNNLGEQPLRLELNSLELQDPLGRLVSPLPPDRLLRAFGTESSATPAARRVSHRTYYVRRYYYRPPRCYPRYSYRYYTGYAWPWYDYRTVGGWGVGGVYYDDPYAEARRTARFLSELLTDQTIPPRHVATGHVVFPYRLRSDDQLTLRMHLEAADGTISTLEFRFEER